MIHMMTRNNPQQRQEQLKKRNRLRKIGKIKKIISYFLILCIVVASHYMVLVIFANSEDSEAQNWAINYLISLAQDMGVNQILKVILTIISLRIMVGAKNQKLKIILKLLIDPVTVRSLAMAAKTMSSPDPVVPAIGGLSEPRN